MHLAKKILIADDHPLFRDALAQAVGHAFSHCHIITCGAFSSLTHCINDHPDVDLILLDLQMPGTVGFSALRYLGLRFPDTPVAIVSAHEEPGIIIRSIHHGASGFIAKSSNLHAIVQAIEGILSGDVVVPEGIDLGQIDVNHVPAYFIQQIEHLTPKQFRVLMMLVDGRTNRDIANELCVTEATIKAHLTEIFKKLNVSNRTQAATLASGYLEVDPPSMTDL